MTDDFEKQATGNGQLKHEPKLKTRKSLNRFISHIFSGYLIFVKCMHIHNK